MALLPPLPATSATHTLARRKRAPGPRAVGRARVARRPRGAMEIAAIAAAKKKEEAIPEAKPTMAEVLQKAGKRALGGGLPGAAAMVVQVRATRSSSSVRGRRGADARARAGCRSNAHARTHHTFRSCR